MSSPLPGTITSSRTRRGRCQDTPSRHHGYSSGNSRSTCIGSPASSSSSRPGNGGEVRCGARAHSGTSSPIRRNETACLRRRPGPAACSVSMLNVHRIARLASPSRGSGRRRGRPRCRAPPPACPRRTTSALPARKERGMNHLPLWVPATNSTAVGPRHRVERDPERRIVWAAVDAVERLVLVPGRLSPTTRPPSPACGRGTGAPRGSPSALAAAAPMPWLLLHHVAVLGRFLASGRSPRRTAQSRRRAPS